MTRNLSLEDEQAEAWEYWHDRATKSEALAADLLVTLKDILTTARFTRHLEENMATIKRIAVRAIQKAESK